MLRNVESNRFAFSARAEFPTKSLSDFTKLLGESSRFPSARMLNAFMFIFFTSDRRNDYAPFNHEAGVMIQRSGR
jgi:hypothetical protein